MANARLFSFHDLITKEKHPIAETGEFVTRKACPAVHR
jgi:hypothetical protein